jgi:Glucose inhibited division protein A
MPTSSATRSFLSVLVIGAGVSGCACAATLASKGARVTLLNSAMDRVGLPAYGPDLVGGAGGWAGLESCVDELPEPLRSVWLGAATKPATDEPVLNIDRRTISIEAKRLLEEVPGLQFRQGFVTALRLVDSSEGRRVEAETVFGELFEADAAVVAVGLGLGGLISAGSHVAPGGRYGEPSSDGLRDALGGLGATFGEIVEEVGARVHLRSAIDERWLGGTKNGGSESCEGGPSVRQVDAMEGESAAEVALVPADVALVAASSGSRQDSWPTEYPPAPHRRADLRFDRIVMERWERGDRAGISLPALSPDGFATQEVYVTPGGRFAAELASSSRGGAGLMLSRVAHSVTGTVVEGLDTNGRLEVRGECGRVWVVGRAAGARDYASSLSSGMRAAVDIVTLLDADAAASASHGPRRAGDTSLSVGHTTPVASERDAGALQQRGDG